jgi:hypothetical protein
MKRKQQPADVGTLLSEKPAAASERPADVGTERPTTFLANLLDLMNGKRMLSQERRTRRNQMDHSSWYPEGKESVFRHQSWKG